MNRFAFRVVFFVGVLFEIVNSTTLTGYVYQYDQFRKKVAMPGVTVTLLSSGESTQTDIYGNWRLTDEVGVFPKISISGVKESLQLTVEGGRLVLRLAGFDVRGAMYRSIDRPGIIARRQENRIALESDTLIYSLDGRKTKRQSITEFSRRVNGEAYYAALLYDSIDRVGGTLVDSRDGQTYPTVKIGKQWWMAKNLNFKVDSSWWASGTVCWNWGPTGGNQVCRIFDDSLTQGTEYGLLYDWASALGFPDSCRRKVCRTPNSSEKIQGICPIGWHVPTDSEWMELWAAVAEYPLVGPQYVASALAGGSWYVSEATVGTQPAWNYLGFDARPSGTCNADGCRGILKEASWWSAIEIDSATSSAHRILPGIPYVWNGHGPGVVASDSIRKDAGLPLRCLQD